MKRINGKIKAWFVTVIGLLVFSHAAVPHHHHYHAVDTHHTSCAQDFAHGFAEKDAPAYHCYAFNGLVHKNKPLAKRIVYQSVAVIPDFDRFPVHFQVAAHYRVPSACLVPGRFYYHPRSLRGPPFC